MFGERLGQAGLQTPRQPECNSKTEEHANLQGLFETVPASWLHQFTQNLPAGSQLSLFRTSKWLARHVLESAAEVTLTLKGQEQLSPAQRKVQHAILTQLLSVRKEFVLDVQGASCLLLPVQLAGQVTCITTNLWHGPVTSPCQWSDMTNLRKVSLVGKHGTTGEELGINSLIAAVEAGQLQQLCSLELQVIHHQPLNVDRLLRALGPQLQELTVKSLSLVMQVGRFTSLRFMKVRYCTLTLDAMQRICNHPTLQHLELESCSVRDDCSQCCCSLQGLTFDGVCNDLVRLPMAGVQQVRILHVLMTEAGHTPPVTFDMIMQHAHKIVLIPGSRKEFWLFDPEQALLPLLAHVQDLEMLKLGMMVMPHVLLLIWQALPTTVRKVLFFYVYAQETGLVWPQLWHNLPQHVTSIALVCCGIPMADFCTLVRTAPPQVHSIRVIPSKDDRYAVSAATLLASAAKHLEVKLVDYSLAFSSSDVFEA